MRKTEERFNVIFLNWCSMPLYFNEQKILAILCYISTLFSKRSLCNMFKFCTIYFPSVWVSIFKTSREVSDNVGQTAGEATITKKDE